MTPTADANATCEHDRELLGAYVLGGLDADEHEMVEGWCASCQPCRRESEELHGLVDLLGHARDHVEPAPDRIRDAVLVQATRRRMARRFSLVLAACVVVAAVAGGLVGWRVAAHEVVVEVAATSVEPFEVTGTVSYGATDDGFVVTLDLSDVPELDGDEVYEAWLYRYDGRIVSLGQLEHDDGRIAAWLEVEGRLEDYRGFWLTAEPDWRDPAHEGPTVVRATVPHW